MEGNQNKIMMKKDDRHKFQLVNEEDSQWNFQRKFKYKSI